MSGVDGGDALASATTCRVVTVGRRTGRDHIVPVWFAVVGNVVYAASRHGREGDWLRNALAAERVGVRCRGHEWAGNAHLVSDRTEARDAVRALAVKYARHRTVVDAWSAHPPVLVGITLTAG